MSTSFIMSKRCLAVAGIAFTGMVPMLAFATEPCDDFDECIALIEINASDGDIGFHFLGDAELLRMQINDPDGTKVFQDAAKGPLVDQKLTETFAESAEPLCWDDPEAEEDEEIVTLDDFVDRWAAGTYVFSGMNEGGEMLSGETELTYNLPAAPEDVDFNEGTLQITWSAGDDLGNCWDDEGETPLPAGVTIDTNPVAWEIVLEPDVDDGDPAGKLKFSIRVDGAISPKVVSVPTEYVSSLPDDTPVKVEVGAIGADDNATFSEADGFCVNDVDDPGCEEE